MAATTKIHKSVTTEQIMDDPQSVKTVSSSRVRTLHCVHPQDCDRLAFLSSGALLRWMDATACMSAERHSQRPSVTISMDDLVLEQWGVPVGHYVELVAQVNNAFNTSMEVGLLVNAEDPSNGKIRVVCSAFFTFVAMGDTGEKVTVPPILVETVDERHAFTLAQERKALRIKKSCLLAASCHVASITSPLSANAHTQGNWDITNVTVPPCSDTITQLVLPQHANHHGNTFGGIVMDWMTEAATVVANRQMNMMKAAVGGYQGGGGVIRMAVMSIDAVTFRGKSKVGDQIDIVATVSCVFSRSMEVAISVDALDVSTNVRRRINTGFITYIATSVIPKSKEDQLTKLELPKVTVAPLPAYEEGSSRRNVRETLLRVFSVRAEPIPWNLNSSKLLQEISICTVWGLLRTAFSAKLKWQKVLAIQRGEVPERGLLPSSIDVDISVNKDSWGMGMISIKASALIPRVHAKKVFDLIVDLEKRVCWDVVLREGYVVKKLDNNNNITREVFDSLTVEGEPHDYALLTACRKMSGHTATSINDNNSTNQFNHAQSDDYQLHENDDNCSFVVASRSVICDDLVPPVNGFRRGEVLPSGFIVESIRPSQSSSSSTKEEHCLGCSNDCECTTRCTYVASLNPNKLGSEVDLHTVALLLHQNISQLAELASLENTALSIHENNDVENYHINPPAVDDKSHPIIQKKKKDSQRVLATLQRIARALRA